MLISLVALLGAIHAMRVTVQTKDMAHVRSMRNGLVGFYHVGNPNRT